MNRTGKPRRTKSSTIAGVASVEPESTTTISAQSRRLSRHLPMQAASLKQITAALSSSARAEDGSERRAGDSVAGSVRAIDLLLSRRGRAHRSASCLKGRAKRGVSKDDPEGNAARARLNRPSSPLRGASGRGPRGGSAPCADIWANCPRLASRWGPGTAVGLLTSPSLRRRLAVTISPQ